MEEIVSAFICETRAMHEACKEHILDLEKKRRKAYDNLASLDFVCSNWTNDADIMTLQTVRSNVSQYIETLVSDLKCIRSIQKEIESRKVRIKEAMTSLLGIYRDLCRDEVASIAPETELSLEREMAETLFEGQGKSLYYAALDPSSSSSSS